MRRLGHQLSARLGTLGVLVTLAVACDDTSYRDIGAEINVLTTRSDALVPPAIARLARFHRRALPQAHPLVAGM